MMLNDEGENLNSGNLWGLQEIRGYGGEYQAKCTVDEIDFKIDGAWGKAEYDWMSDNYKLDGSVYKF